MADKNACANAIQDNLFHQLVPDVILPNKQKILQKGYHI